MAQPHPGTGLVHEVDGLVGEGPVGDVADGEVDRGAQRLIGVVDVMVLFVSLPDAEQDLVGLVDGRLVDHDRLEAALEGGVLLDVLAVLVQGRGPDALELAPGQRRLEDVGRVDGALRRTRPDQGVQLVDEQDRVAARAQLLDDLLQPLLELAAVLRAGHQRTDVQGQHPLVGERVGNVTGHDPMGEGLGDGGLAHAGLPDERGVVLRLAPQDLDDALDLLLPTDDRVQLAGARQLGEVDAQRVQGGGLGRPLGFLGRGGGAALGQDVDDLVPNLVQVDAQALEHAGGDPLALADEAQQQVLGTDVVVTEAARLVDGQLDDPLGPRREADLAHDRALASTDDELDRLPHLGQLDVHVLEHARGHALALAHQAEEKVLGPDVVVVEALRFILGQGQDLACPIGELVETVHTYHRVYGTTVVRCVRSPSGPLTVVYPFLPSKMPIGSPMCQRTIGPAGSDRGTPLPCGAVRQSEAPAGRTATFSQRSPVARRMAKVRSKGAVSVEVRVPASS